MVTCNVLSVSFLQTESINAHDSTDQKGVSWVIFINGCCLIFVDRISLFLTLEVDYPYVGLMITPQLNPQFHCKSKIEQTDHNPNHHYPLGFYLKYEPKIPELLWLLPELMESLLGKEVCQSAPSIA